MKIVGIMVARNEEDIVAQTLASAASQLDAVLFADCGSDDTTYSVAHSVAARCPNIALLPPLRPSLPDGMRRQIWSAIRTELAPQDWFVIVDADEFLEEQARTRFDTASSLGADHIFSAHVNFYYTRAEAEAWRSGKEGMSDRVRPIQERRHFYCMQTSMPRAWRNHRHLRWNKESYLPSGVTHASPERLVYLHYQYRDLPQIEARMLTRSSIPANSQVAAENPHWLHNSIEALLSADDDPRLIRAEPGIPFVPDPALPPVPAAPAWKVKLKFARAIVTACLEPQCPSTFAHAEELKPLLAGAIGSHVTVRQ